MLSWSHTNLAEVHHQPYNYCVGLLKYKLLEKSSSSPHTDHDHSSGTDFNSKPSSGVFRSVRSLNQSKKKIMKANTLSLFNLKVKIIDDTPTSFK